MVKENLVQRILSPQNLRFSLNILIVVAILCIIQIGLFCLFISGILDADITKQFILNTTTPTFLSAFTTNYIHISIDHLLKNIEVFVFAAILICSIYCIYEQTSLKIPKIYFIFYAIFAFLIFPFIISFGTCCFPPAEIVMGFSGIVSACLGALIALLYPYLNLKNLGHILSYVPVATLFIGYLHYIYSVDLNSLNNVLINNASGHITGACCGFLFTLIFEGVYRYIKTRRNQSETK